MFKTLPTNSHTQSGVLRHTVTCGLLEKMHSGGFCEKSFFALSRLYFDHRFSLGNSRERTLWVNHLHFHSSIHLVIDFSTQKSGQATVNHQRVSESLYSIT